MANPQVEKSDGAINTAIGIIDDNRSFLQQQMAVGQRISEEVAANFISGASMTFQQKVDDWVQLAQAVIRSFDTLEDDLKGASNELDSGTESALQAAQSWGGGDNPVFGVLTGAP
jgi:uncharacterized protein YukE